MADMQYAGMSNARATALADRPNALSSSCKISPGCTGRIPFLNIHALKLNQLTSDRLQDLLASAETEMNRDTIWRFLKRDGLSFKKLCSRLSRPERQQR